MRYSNWDILIFAEAGDTKTPLQEFRTICEVVQDASEQLLSPPIPHIYLSIFTYEQVLILAGTGQPPLPVQPSYFSAMTRPVPIVSCYLPSLTIGCPFRVSIHSWDAPKATAATKSMAHDENMAVFEAKVLIDGTCVAYVNILLNLNDTQLTQGDSGAVFGTGETWPQIIGDSSMPLFKENTNLGEQT